MMYVGIILVCATNLAQTCQIKSRNTAYVSKVECLTEVGTIVGNMSEMGMIGTGSCLEISKGEKT